MKHPTITPKNISTVTLSVSLCSMVSGFLARIAHLVTYIYTYTLYPFFGYFRSYTVSLSISLIPSAIYPVLFGHGGACPSAHFSLI